MSEEAALLAAVLDDPADVAPRLVYADWLDEHSQGESAEFIRAQVELARDDLPAARRLALRRRERELLTLYRDAWAGEAPGGCRLGFARGFIEQVAAAPMRFRRHAAALVERYPIRTVRLASLSMYSGDARLARFFRWLAGWRRLRQVESLAFWGHSAGGGVTIDPAGLDVLLASKHLGGLRELDVSDNVGMEGTGASLAGSPVLGRLTALTLTLIGPGTAAALAGSGRRPALQRLRLSYNEIGPREARQLAGWPALGAVTDLDVSFNPLGPAGAAALAASPHLGGLRRLNLRDTRVGDRGLAALADGDKLGGLSWLSVEQLVARPAEAVGAEGAALARAARGLAVLNLRGNRLDAAAARELAGAPGLAGLRALNVGVNGLGDDGARALAASPHLRGLRWLALYANGITDDGLRALVASPVVDRLRTLLLEGNLAMTDAAGRLLAESPRLGRLRRLTLGGGFGGPTRRLLRDRFGAGVRFG